MEGDKAIDMRHQSAGALVNYRFSHGPAYGVKSSMRGKKKKKKKILRNININIIIIIIINMNVLMLDARRTSTAIPTHV